MKARLLALAITLGAGAGCASHSHSHQEVEPARSAQEVHDELAADIEAPPFYRSPLRWSGVFWGMIEIGVLPEEADFQIRRALRTTISSQDVDLLFRKHTTAEAFLDALDALYVSVVAANAPKEDKGFDYGLESAHALELWQPFARMVDRPPRCGNSLHWLPVYKDLMRLGYEPKGAIRVCRRSVRAGLSRIEVEALIDSSKRDQETFATNFEVARDKAEARHDVATSMRGLKGFFVGKKFSPKPKPQEAMIGGDAPAETAAPPAETPAEAPAEPPAGELAPPSAPPAEPFDEPPPPFEDAPPESGGGTELEEGPIGSPTVDEPPVGSPTVDEPPVGSPAVGQPPVGSQPDPN